MDINVPVKDGKIEGSNLRLRECAKSIEAYSKNGIIPIIMSHQGRLGDDDYLESMEQHADALNSFLKDVTVLYSDSLADETTRSRAGALKLGEALLLKNLRSNPDEKRKFENRNELENCNLIKGLSSSASFFINDAPANMHRADASQVGFRNLLPSYLGILMEKELKILEKAKEDLDSSKKTLLIFGGKKWEKFNYIYKIAGRKNVRVLCGGIPGQSISYVKNKPLFNKASEDFLLKTDTLDTAIKLSTEFGERIISPTDFILEGGENVGLTDLKKQDKTIMDIGDETMNSFYDAIDQSEVIIYAGPVGRFEYGYDQTRKLINKLIESDATSYTLGGNSVDSLRHYGLEEKYLASKGTIVTSGGSGLALLSDSELPALEVFTS